MTSKCMDGLEEWREKLLKGEVETAPKESNPVRRYWNSEEKGEKSLVKAIAAMCAHCVGCTREEVEPGFRETIRDCTSTDCPLYSHRPYKSDRGDCIYTG